MCVFFSTANLLFLTQRNSWKSSQFTGKLVHSQLTPLIKITWKDNWFIVSLKSFETKARMLLIQQQILSCSSPWSKQKQRNFLQVCMYGHVSSCQHFSCKAYYLLGSACPSFMWDLYLQILSKFIKLYTI